MRVAVAVRGPQTSLGASNTVVMRYCFWPCAPRPLQAARHDGERLLVRPAALIVEP
jgi:hypothetical protein